MSNRARKLFTRIKNYVFLETPKPEPMAPVYGWQLPNYGPAAMPPNMQTWKADPVEDKGLFEELNPTQQIAKIVPGGPEQAFIALATSDKDATNTAARALRTTRSVAVTLAGIREYVARHPVAA